MYALNLDTKYIGDLKFVNTYDGFFSIYQKNQGKYVLMGYLQKMSHKECDLSLFRRAYKNVIENLGDLK